MDKNFEFRKEMQHRTKQFALRIVRLFQALPATDEARIIGKQLLRSATSVGANYRAACRARSSKEFYSKLSIVINKDIGCSKKNNQSKLQTQSIN